MVLNVGHTLQTMKSDTKTISAAFAGVMKSDAQLTFEFCSPEMACMLVHSGSLAAARCAVSCLLSAARSVSDQAHFQASTKVLISLLNWHVAKAALTHSMAYSKQTPARTHSGGQNLAWVTLCNPDCYIDAASGRSCMFDDVVSTDISNRGKDFVKGCLRTCCTFAAMLVSWQRNRLHLKCKDLSHQAQVWEELGGPFECHAAVHALQPKHAWLLPPRPA